MLRKRVFGTMAFIVGVLLVLGFVACDDGSGKNNNNNNNGANPTADWPSAAVLSEFGISGLTVPAGATDIESNKASTGNIARLSIVFKSYPTSDNPFHQTLLDNKWDFDEDSSFDYYEEHGYGSLWVYYKDNDQAMYSWNHDSGSSFSVTLY